MFKQLLLILVLGSLLGLSQTLSAQNSFPNTLTYHDSIGSPKADLSAIAWLAGHWRGEAFGGIVEEAWTTPLGGSMMGSFKLVVEGEVQFYELETIVEEEGSLILRLKHFNGDLTGWEEKDKTVDFPLVKVEPNKVYFGGFTIEKISDDAITMYVIVGSEGKAEEVSFAYKRVKD